MTTQENIQERTLTTVLTGTPKQIDWAIKIREAKRVMVKAQFDRYDELIDALPEDDPNSTGVTERLMSLVGVALAGAAATSIFKIAPAAFWIDARNLVDEHFNDFACKTNSFKEIFKADCEAAKAHN